MSRGRNRTKPRVPVRLPTLPSISDVEVTLSDEQQRAVDAAVRGDNMFITGVGGTGKSITVEHIVRALDADRTVAVAASTGVAAVRLGGTTIHSFLCTGMRKHAKELDSIDPDRVDWPRLWETDALVVDEVSMLPGDFISMMDRWLRQARNESTVPFGGMQLIFTGDFLQLPPVFRYGEPEPDARYAFQSTAWREAKLTTVVLSKVFRQSDEEFIARLNELRTGRMTNDTFAYFNARIDAELEAPVHLYALNREVDGLNEEELRKMPGQRYTYRAELSGRQSGKERLCRDCITPEHLHLKVDAPVLFTRNRMNEAGQIVHANGDRGVVVECGNKIVVAMHNGRVVTVDKSLWELRDSSRKVVASMRQYPLRLAWALTIHKSQGMTLDELSCELGGCFAPGQAYVALSRGREYSGISLPSSMHAGHVRVDPDIVAYYDSLS